MLGPIDDATLAAMPEKTKKHPAVVELYRRHDYLTAYALHTDMRIREGGPASAVGAEHDWERHGLLQSEFLKQMGLCPNHQFLEIGCGTGRLARKIVPYLHPGGYTGVDISKGAIEAARALSIEEGWVDRSPVFSQAMPGPYEDQRSIGRTFNCVWAFSVFTHLPAPVVETIFSEVAQLLAWGGVFYFSYVPEAANERTGLKQFRHTVQVYEQACRKARLFFARVPQWTGEQRIGSATRFAHAR